MGMEALETVVGYWEDALSAYRSNSLDTAAASGKSVPPPPMLTTAEETVFVRLLENILEGAYQLQARGCFFRLPSSRVMLSSPNVAAVLHRKIPSRSSSTRTLF